MCLHATFQGEGSTARGKLYMSVRNAFVILRFLSAFGDENLDGL